MQARRVKICGTGKYLPPQAVTAADLDVRMGQEPGWAARYSGVLVRHFATDETTSMMGARAAQAALDQAGWTYADLDVIVGVSGIPEQAIPCTAALIQKAMGQETSGTPAFDLNATCLSFVTGLDVLGTLVDAGRYRRVLLVSSEMPSIGINWAEHESATILGDGAAAAVIERTPEGEGSQILCARMETYSNGSELTRHRGGGSRFHPRRFEGDLATYTSEYSLFEMDGPAVFKLSAQILPGFVRRLLEPAGLTMADVKLVVPHQASPSALWLMQRRLGIPEEKFMFIAADHGNTVAASIPMALHEAVQRGRIVRGDRVLLLGTSAGISVGGLVLDY